MGKTSPLSDLRGAGRLAADLTVLVTDLVETMHHNVSRFPGLRGRSTFAPTQGITGLVYRSVRGVTRLVGSTADGLLTLLVPLVGNRSAWRGRDRVLGVLNGVLGDHLEATGNPLAFSMQLRHRGSALTLERAPLAARIPHARKRVIVMLHGLCMSDSSWARDGYDHGHELARDLDADVVYLRYNSGRHISTNGAEFAALLEQLVNAWPVPLQELLLVGHSMGGLVMRSACATGEALGHTWLRSLRALLFIGTPHSGAPLERGGHGIDQLISASPYTVAFTRLSHLRSAGITDLRHGSVLAEDWQGRDRFAHAGYLRHAQPLPRGVPAFAVAGSLSKRPSLRGATPRGDGLLSVASALGKHREPARRLDIAPSCRWVAYDTGHLELLSSAAVYQQMRSWLQAECSAASHADLPTV